MNVPRTIRLKASYWRAAAAAASPARCGTRPHLPCLRTAAGLVRLAASPVRAAARQNGRSVTPCGRRPNGVGRPGLRPSQEPDVNDDEIRRRFDGRPTVELRLGHAPAQLRSQVERVANALGYRHLAAHNLGPGGCLLVFGRDDNPVARQRAAETQQRLCAGGALLDAVGSPSPPPPGPPPAARPEHQLRGPVRPPSEPPPPPPLAPEPQPKSPPPPSYPPRPGSPP